MTPIEQPDTDDGRATSWTSSSTTRPPTGLIGAQVALLLVVLASFILGGFGMNAIEAVVGVFGSVLLFAIVRMVDDRRRIDPSYTDWSGVSARRISAWIMGATWIAGLGHMYEASVEATRILNL
ncbi:MAG: hypothetical protein M3094_08005 [Actinomycetia bacterium]|nr:hypothetical protein [Actinomycetes bacterium]